MQMKGKREFPPDIPASGDVLSHLSESELLLFLLMLNTDQLGCGNVRMFDSRLKGRVFTHSH